MNKRFLLVVVWVLAMVLMPAGGWGQGVEVRETPAEAATSAEEGVPGGVRLENGAVFVEVSPGWGRVSAFGRAGGENLLYWNPDAEAGPRTATGEPYRNVGGDKLWPLVQTLWPRAYGTGPWPPEGTIDGRAWEVVDESPTHVTMRSPISPELGIQVTRRVELTEEAEGEIPDASAEEPASASAWEGGEVTITNTLTAVRPGLFPVMAWTVTQVRHPAVAMLGVSPEVAKYAENGGTGVPGFRALSDPPLPGSIDMGEQGDWFAWRLDPSSSRAGKIGTLGGWVAAVYDDLIFLQHAPFVFGGAYPDATSAQLYADGNYLELELLSPARHLKQGEELTNTVTWKLVPRDERDLTAVAAWAGEVAGGGGGSGEANK